MSFLLNHKFDGESISTHALIVFSMRMFDGYLKKYTLFKPSSEFNAFS